MEKPCREPNLDELFDDSAMRLLLASDKVDETGLRTLLGTLRRVRPAPVPARDAAACRCC